MEITRRKFLGLTAAAAGLSLLPVEFKELVAAVGESEHQWPGPGIETMGELRLPALSGRVWNSRPPAR